MKKNPCRHAQIGGRCRGMITGAWREKSARPFASRVLRASSNAVDSCTWSDPSS